MVWHVSRGECGKPAGSCLGLVPGDPRRRPARRRQRVMPLAKAHQPHAVAGTSQGGEWLSDLHRRRPGRPGNARPGPGSSAAGKLRRRGRPTGTGHPRLDRMVSLADRVPGLWNMSRDPQKRAREEENWPADQADQAEGRPTPFAALCGATGKFRRMNLRRRGSRPPSNWALCACQEGGCGVYSTTLADSKHQAPPRHELWSPNQSLADRQTAHSAPMLR